MAGPPYGPLTHDAPNRHRMLQRCKREESLYAHRFDFVATVHRTTFEAILENPALTVSDMESCTRTSEKGDNSPA